MYGFELVIVWVGIGAAVIYGLKWVYQNAFSHYQFKTKVIMAIIGLVFILITTFG